MTSDIAVIGIGCRFPGADNIEEFWRVLVNGENHVIDIPDDRWNNEAFFSENKDEKGKYNARKAAFLKRHDEWDNKFFGLSDYEAAQVDPQQRYVLECTHMAFEDGGLTNEQLKGSETGVFIGCMSEDYKGLFDFDHEHDNSYTITGTNGSIISARVSYVYDLRGPCMVVNTACSSSMTAIHLACQAINSGDCEMAVCGGVASILAPNIFVPASKAGMMSAAGQCQAFCDTADGYVRGEGCGILILKSYEKAVNDKNRIWGIIRTGVNQDGHVAQPITAPAGEQQEKLLEKLYRKYSMDPNDIQYIECHGTGTPVGDPVEVNALGRFRTYFRSEKLKDVKDLRNDDEKIMNTIRSLEDITSKILIGSVKTNIGHLEAAAGVAGVIKVLLMMDHGQFVPSLHAKHDKSNWNKRIHFEEYALDISLAVSPWKTNKHGERIGCVNSFGFGGSNSHCIIVQKNSDIDLAEETHEPKLKLICVSANDKTSLVNSMEALGRDLERTEHSLLDVSFTSIFHRNHYKCRALLFGEASNDIRSQISKQIAIIENPEMVQNHNVVFLFSGMGTAWNGMCQELMNTQPIFRETVQNIDTILEKSTGFRMEEKFRKETVYNDPFLDALGIFYVQIGLYHLWKSWGILPNVVLGQSVGEVAAAYASGALTLLDAARIIYVRSKYISKQTGGKMCVVGNVAESVLKGLCDKYDNKVVIAVINSPTSFTLSGDADIIEMIMSDLFEIGRKQNQTILIRSLSVRCAYHSRHMDSCLDDIAKELKCLEGGAMICKQISTVSGKLVENNVFTYSQYWKDNVRQPVQFMQAVKNCAAEDSTNIFIEVGPKPVLRTHMETLFTDQQRNICVSSIREKWENHTLYASLGKLYQLGIHIYWPNVVSPVGRAVPIPRYIFHKSKNLFIPHGHKLLLKAVPKESNAHMYLVTSENDSEDFHINVNQNTTPFIFDHFFFDSCLVPGVTYVEAGFEIGILKTKCNPYEIEIFSEFIKTMTASSDKTQVITMTVNEDSQLLSFSAKNEGKTLCTGRICMRKTIGTKEIDIAKVKDRCTTYFDKNACYTSLEKYHFKYGNSLKVIEEAWSSETECLGRIHLPDSVLIESKHTNIHPSALDAMMQTVATMRFHHADYTVPYLPKMLGSVLLNRPIQKSMYAYSHIIRHDEEGYHYNCLLSCPNGQVIAEIHNFHFQKMNTESHSPMNVTFNTVNWRLTNTNFPKYPSSDARCKADQVAILCSKRFAEKISVAKRIDTAYVHVLDEVSSQNKTLLTEWLKPPSLNTIVYAPCHHTEEGQLLGHAISELAHSSFLNLQYLLQYIIEHHLNVTVYAITESVWSNIRLEEQSKTNVLGSELWGMVRSAMLELPEIDLRLIDMVLSEKNMDTLLSILHIRDSVEKEILLRDGQVFHCEMSEYDIEEDKHLKRDINFDGSDDVVLKSKNPSVIKFPYFEISRSCKETMSPTDCQLKVQEVFLHDPNLYPVTSAFFDTDETIWPEDSEEGFQVICLEGYGFKIDPNLQDSKNTKIGFCFPVEVASVVTVSDKCTFEIGDIPCYHPGMVTVGVILWNVIQHAKISENTCIVVNEVSNLWIQIAKHMLSMMDSVCHVINRNDILQRDCSNLENMETVIILSAITHKHIEQIVAKCPKIKCIISTEHFLSIHTKVRLEVHVRGINVVVLSIEHILDPASLELSVAQVCNSLRKIKDGCSLAAKPFQHAESDIQVDILSLPFLTLSVSAQTVEYNRIPLKVDSASIFSKNGCYIVVGGLTGLGWILVEYLAELGAGYIATFSRRKASREQEEQMALIQTKHHCRIIAMQVNISSLGSLETALETLKLQIGSCTIRGVFHGGGILCDKQLKQMSEEDIKGPMLPKILGTWNLHAATLNCPLDFFVMHSSISSVFGSQGQCNYAAGNSFEDAFAYYRRQLGLCGQSINWSALSVGMSTSDSRLENYWKSMGFYVLTKEDIRKSFSKLMMGNFEQMICGKFDWIKLGESQVVSSQLRKFSNIMEKYSGNLKIAKHSEHTFSFDEYIGLDKESQHRIIYDIAKSSLSDAIVIDKNTLKEDTQFSSLGIDSMSAMSLVNMIFDIMQVRVPLENVLTGSSTLNSLTSLIKQKLNSKQPKLASRNKQNDPNILQLTCEEMLRVEVTFLQKNILEKVASGGNEVQYIFQMGCDIHGVEISKEKLRMVAKTLCMRHRELRKIYHRNDNQTFRAELLGEDQISVDVKEIEFDSTDFETDNRTNIHFDPAKDVPVKFKIATKKECTKVIIYFHALAFDLASMDPFVKDLRSCLQSENLEETNENASNQESVARLLSNAILPQTDELLQYWIRQVNQDIQPLTLGSNVNDNLLKKKMCKLSLNVPSAWVERINAFTQKRGISLYEYVVSAYFATLHEKTKKDIFPLVTRADLRGSVPQLKGYVARCVNLIPLIGNFKNIGTVSEYLENMCVMMREATQYNLCPFSLIIKAVENEELRRHIGRHDIGYNNLTNLHNSVAKSKHQIKLRNFFHAGHSVETFLFIEHDSVQNNLELIFQYETQIVSEDVANMIMERFFYVLRALMAHEDAELKQILHKRDFEAPEQHCPKKHSAIKTNENYAEIGQRSLIRCDTFIEQMSCAKNEMIHLQVVKEKFDSGKVGIVLVWRRSDNTVLREVSADTISEVVAKEDKDQSYIMLKTGHRWLICKTSSREASVDWVHMFKHAVETVRPKSHS